jgi:hypothetical protein
MPLFCGPVPLCLHRCWRSTRLTDNTAHCRIPLGSMSPFARWQPPSIGRGVLSHIRIKRAAPYLPVVAPNPSAAGWTQPCSTRGEVPAARARQTCKGYCGSNGNTRGPERRGNVGGREDCSVSPRFCGITHCPGYSGDPGNWAVAVHNSSRIPGQEVPSQGVEIG